MAFAEETAQSDAAATAAEGDTAAGIAESEAQQNSVFSLGEVEVMSTIDNSGNPTADRIYSKEMREFNADTVADTAKLFPGVTLDRIGARNETMIRIRGFDQKQVPIYLDGVPIYVPTTDIRTWDGSHIRSLRGGCFQGFHLGALRAEHSWRRCQPRQPPPRGEV